MRRPMSASFSHIPPRITENGIDAGARHLIFCQSPLSMTAFITPLVSVALVLSWPAGSRRSLAIESWVTALELNRRLTTDRFKLACYTMATPGF